MTSKNIDSTKMVQNIAVSLSDQSVIRPICLQEQIHIELSFERSQGIGSFELKRQGIIQILDHCGQCAVWTSVALFL